MHYCIYAFWKHSFITCKQTYSINIPKPLPTHALHEYSWWDYVTVAGMASMGPIPLPLCCNTHTHKQLYLLGTEHTELFWTDSQIIFKQSGLVLKNFLYQLTFAPVTTDCFCYRIQGLCMNTRVDLIFIQVISLAAVLMQEKHHSHWIGGFLPTIHRWTFKTETVTWINRFQLPVWEEKEFTRRIMLCLCGWLHAWTLEKVDGNLQGGGHGAERDEERRWRCERKHEQTNTDKNKGRQRKKDAP